ncbi:hypothetical protein CLU79DRAFT_532509 [Phycomyces nitens]|nr:hypothetical protein CLU79DRAFT_532509 [Phycomyces nitens]
MGLSKKSQTYIDIDLHNNRFYFPGDIIRGDVILDLAKPTKTQHIKLSLTGDVQADSNSVKLFTQTVFLAEAPNNKKTYLLQAKLHRFTFEIQIPTKQECDLPSSAETLKHGTIRYYLVATHSKAAMFGALSLQTKRSISILEHIDVSLSHHTTPAEVTAVMSPVAIHDQKVRLKASIPKTAIVRGDILPVTIEIQHFCAMSRKSAIKVQLIRRLHYGKGKGNILEQISIRTNLLNINIKSSGNFSQVCQSNVFIPTKTPPTIDRCGRLISVEYFIRIIVNINERTIQVDNPKNFVFLELPILIGTFPRPELCIDGDDDYDNEEVVDIIEEKKRAKSMEIVNFDPSRLGMSTLTLSESLKDDQSVQTYSHEEIFCVDIPPKEVDLNQISIRSLALQRDIYRSSAPITLSSAMSSRISSIPSSSSITDNSSSTPSIVRHGTQSSSRSFDSRFSESTQSSLATLQGDGPIPIKYDGVTYLGTVEEVHTDYFDKNHHFK